LFSHKINFKDQSKPYKQGLELFIILPSGVFTFQKKSRISPMIKKAARMSGSTAII